MCGSSNHSYVIVVGAVTSCRSIETNIINNVGVIIIVTKVGTKVLGVHYVVVS